MSLLSTLFKSELLVYISITLPLDNLWVRFLWLSRNIKIKSCFQIYNIVSFACFHKYPSLMEFSIFWILNNPLSFFISSSLYIQSFSRASINDNSTWVNNTIIVNRLEPKKLPLIIWVKCVISQNSFNFESFFSTFISFNPKVLLISWKICSFDGKELIWILFSFFKSYFPRFFIKNISGDSVCNFKVFSDFLYKEKLISILGIRWSGWDPRIFMFIWIINPESLTIFWDNEIDLSNRELKSSFHYYYKWLVYRFYLYWDSKTINLKM